MILPFSDEMVMSELSIVVRKTLGLMLQQKPPNIGDISSPKISVGSGT